MLNDLVRNLLHNAIKHTPQGGLLWLRLEADETHARLSVLDSGPGIGDELRSRLFQPFSAGNVGSGSGLGLAICQEIVQALGGSIALDNRENHGGIAGLAATVTLPLAHNGP
jgi:two-component system sensor histidine kinase TctE